MMYLLGFVGSIFALFILIPLGLVAIIYFKYWLKIQNEKYLNENYDRYSEDLDYESTNKR